MEKLSQRTGETYSQWEKRVFCDNASRRGLGISLNPQCCDGKREFECTVKYNKVSGDSFVLCGECRDGLRREAKRFGYRFSSKPVKTR